MRIMFFSLVVISTVFIGPVPAVVGRWTSSLGVCVLIVYLFTQTWTVFSLVGFCSFRHGFFRTLRISNFTNRSVIEIYLQMSCIDTQQRINQGVLEMSQPQFPQSPCLKVPQSIFVIVAAASEESVIHAHRFWFTYNHLFMLTWKRLWCHRPNRGCCGWLPTLTDWHDHHATMTPRQIDACRVWLEKRMRMQMTCRCIYTTLTKMRVYEIYLCAAVWWPK